MSHCINVHGDLVTCLILWTFFELQEFLFVFKVLGSSTGSDSSVCVCVCMYMYV